MVLDSPADHAPEVLQSLPMKVTRNKQTIGDYSLLISKLYGEIKFVLIKVLTAVLVRVYVHCVECCSCS